MIKVNLIARPVGQLGRGETGTENDRKRRSRVEEIPAMRLEDLEFIAVRIREFVRKNEVK